jgi:TRAP-type C4-dicarboxylate transport system permease small subunit
MEHAASAYRQLDTFIGRLAQKIHNIASQVLLTMMTGIIALEVLFRYFLGAGFKWTQEVCGLCFLLLVFICQANTWQENRHIRMDIFYSRFNDTFKRFSDMLTIICGCILYAAIVWQGITDFKYQFMVNEGTEELMWPLWPFNLIIVISGIITVVLLLSFCFTILLRKRK